MRYLALITSLIALALSACELDGLNEETIPSEAGSMMSGEIAGFDTSAGMDDPAGTTNVLAGADDPAGSDDSAGSDNPAGTNDPAGVDNPAGTNDSAGSDDPAGADITMSGEMTGGEAMQSDCEASDGVCREGPDEGPTCLDNERRVRLSCHEVQAACCVSQDMVETCPPDNAICNRFCTTERMPELPEGCEEPVCDCGDEPTCPTADAICDRVCARGEVPNLPEGCMIPDCTCSTDPINCVEPNPQGCRESSACGDQEQCVREVGDCAPSSCQCDLETGLWFCTRDCVGRCVPSDQEGDPLECPSVELICDDVCLGLTPHLPAGCTLPPDCRCEPTHDCALPNPQGCRDRSQCEANEQCVRTEGECHPSNCDCDIESGAWRCTRDCVGRCALDTCPNPAQYCEEICNGERISPVPDGCPIPLCNCPEMCGPRSCGPPLPPAMCPDGSVPHMTCEVNDRGRCSWQIAECDGDTNLICREGAERDAEDGCNTCVCEHGEWICTNLPCPEINACEEAGGTCRGDIVEIGMCLDGETRIRSACGRPNQACCIARDNGVQPCGGILGATCPEGLVCIDNPNDQCDPERGGADCPGTCQDLNQGACCEALTATCLACAAGQSVQDYCRENPNTVGCNVP